MGDFTLDIGGYDPAFAPKGGARYLEKAVLIVADGSELSLSERREIEEAITLIAAEFNRELALQDESARIRTVVDQLQAIEDACSALADTFDSASHAAFHALGGHGIGGLPLRNLGSAIGDPDAPRRHVMATLSSRYRIPIAPPSSADVLENWSAQPASGNIERLAALADWPVAIRALAETVRAQREDYQGHFRAQLARFRDVVEHGPEGTLLSTRKRNRRGAVAKSTMSGAAKRESSKATGKPIKPRVLYNNPSSAPDLGGKENVNDLMRGQPKWILARECCRYLSGFLSWESMRGPPKGNAYLLTLAAYAYATGEDVDEVETSGGAYDAGLGRHVRAALKILPALVAINMRKGHANPFAPLTDEEYQQRVSLEWSLTSGRPPAWLD